MPTINASVYVIGCDLGPQKIGVSGNLNARLGALRRRSGGPVRVNWHREYKRDIAFRIESIIKRICREAHLQNEVYSLCIEQCVSAIIIAEHICFGLELPRMTRARRLDADRVRAGMTKRSLATVLDMPESAFSAAFAATLRGKSMSRAPDLLDRIEGVLASCSHSEILRPTIESGLTLEADSGDIHHSVVAPFASREPIKGSRPRQ